MFREIDGQEFNPKKLKLSSHAFERCQLRLGYKEKEKELACGNLRNILNSAEYIGVTTSEDGNDAHLFSKDKTAIHVSMDLKTIVTVIKFNQPPPNNPLHNEIIGLYKKEFRKLNKTERSRVKRLQSIKLKSNIEISELEYRAFKTRSKSVLKECESRIEELKQHISQLEKEIKSIQFNKKQIAYAITSMV